jgi:uncharacterized protein with gpF-like domain
MNGVTDTNTGYMEREAAKYFREQKGRVKAAIEALGEKEAITAAGIFDLEAEGEITKRLAMQTFPTMALRAGNAALTPIKAFYEKVDDVVMDRDLIEIVDARAKLFATSVAGVTYDKLGKLVAVASANGVGRDVLARTIFNAFDDMTRVRAKRIAQTEAGNMTSVGTQHAFDKEPLVTGKQWITAKDGKVRDEHLANDDRVVDKDVAFPNGEMYPAETTINCRCVMAPVIKSTE